MPTGQNEIAITRQNLKSLAYFKTSIAKCVRRTRYIRKKKFFMVEVQTQNSLSPNTTAQEDITFAGQRKINLIWEVTQSAIALLAMSTALVVSSKLALSDRQSEAAYVFLTGMAGLIIGFYFSRTNHSAIGGVGAKPEPPYTGR